MQKSLIKILFFTLISSQIFAKHIHKEKYYQVRFCKSEKGIIEYKLSDNTRVDCLTATHAIEVEFARKWEESIGQSLYYSIMTKKKAGVYLIIESDKDYKYLKRLKKVAKKYNIDIYRSDIYYLNNNL